jgi:hypothetical protein
MVQVSVPVLSAYCPPSISLVPRSVEVWNDCRPVGTPAEMSVGFSVRYPCRSQRSLGFQRDHRARRLESCVPVSFAPVQERPMLTDTILIIRCPYCMAGIDFSPMIAYKDGRFVCRDCAHTVRPGVPEYGCTCRPCLRLPTDLP